MPRPRPPVRLHTQDRGWTDAEEGFRLAFIAGSMTYQSLLKKFRLPATRAGEIIRSCPECQLARRQRYAQNKREALKKQRMQRYQKAMEHISELHADLLDRIQRLSDRIKVLEEMMNVQTHVDDGSVECE